MENERVWRTRMESERVWRPRMESERVWRPRMEKERVWRPRVEISQRAAGNAAPSVSIVAETGGGTVERCGRSNEQRAGDR